MEARIAKSRAIMSIASEFMSPSEKAEEAAQPPTPNTEMAPVLAETIVPAGKKPNGKIVGTVVVKGGATLEVDKAGKALAERYGYTVRPVDKEQSVPVVEPEAPVRRVHRKKPIASKEASTEQVIEAVAKSRTASQKAASAPLCTQCIRAMSLVHRINAAVEGYRTTCDTVIDKLPVGSETRAQATELRDAASIIARHAQTDSQYVLRSLACARGCILSTTVTTHITPSGVVSS